MIFLEGISARTFNGYDETFIDLTPAMRKFATSESALMVEDYFNHTAATFRGLLGQLCSLHPPTIAHELWRERKPAQFFCLQHLLAEAGYQTTFLDPHERQGDYLNDMLVRLDFHRVLTAREIKEDGELHHGALTNADLFDGLLSFLRDAPADQPFFVATYPFQTHAFFDTGTAGVKYGDGRNEVLNIVHDVDRRFAEFWREFESLAVYPDTVVVLTSDHAHYHDDAYLRALAEAGVRDYEGYFVDRIPFIIHDPRRTEAARFSADGATSIAFAPTLAHYLGLPNVPNPFVGRSIFDGRDGPGVASFSRYFYVVTRNGVKNISRSHDQEHRALRHAVRETRRLVLEDRIWPAEPASGAEQ